MRRPLRLSLTVPVVALAVAAAGCSTFQYRAIQTQFSDAARADNDSSVDALSASTAETAYAAIVTDLTPDRIAKLDPTLHGNAWVIRSYSQWRSGHYTEAIDTAGTGIATPGLGARDRVLLTLLPALAIDSQAVDRWNAKRQQLTGAEYADFGRDFSTAYGELEKTKSAIDASAAPSTRYYVAYQRWRILNDWSIIIGTIDWDLPGNSAARQAARGAAETLVGGTLSSAAKDARDSIPDGHPLRQLIKAQGGG
jgi:hypothetical protein